MTAAIPTKKSGPPSGVRVLDLTSVLTGPYHNHTQVMTDLRADATDVERPDVDTFRYVDLTKSKGWSGIFTNLEFRRARHPAGHAHA